MHACKILSLGEEKGICRKGDGAKCVSTECVLFNNEYIFMGINVLEMASQSLVTAYAEMAILEDMDMDIHTATITQRLFIEEIRGCVNVCNNCS